MWRRIIVRNIGHITCTKGIRNLSFCKVFLHLSRSVSESDSALKRRLGGFISRLTKSRQVAKNKLRWGQSVRSSSDGN